MSTSPLCAFALLRLFILRAALLLGVAPTHAGLVLHYAFDETSGTTAADSSGNGNTGILTNMSGTEWTTGKIGGALSMNIVEGYSGGNDRVKVPHSVLNGASTFSIAAWINLHSYSLHGPVFFIDATSGIGEDFAIGINNTTQTFIQEQGGGGNMYASTNATYQNNWTHLVITQSATSGNRSYKYYFDGTLVTTKDTGTRTSNQVVVSDGLWIGGDASASFAYQTLLAGSLDEFRIYDHALSASEVSALHLGIEGGSAAPEPVETFAFLGLLVAFGLGFREWRARRKQRRSCLPLFSEMG